MRRRRWPIPSTAVLRRQSSRARLTETAAALGADDRAYRRLIGSVVRDWPRLTDVILGPPGLPAHPLAAARFGLAAMQSAERLAERRFRTDRARSLLAGNAAHGMRPLDTLPSGAIGLVLAAVAHTHGWPIPRGGAQRLADALGSYLRSLGGEIVTGQRIEAIEDLPPARAILCDLSPRPFLRIAGRALPDRYRRQLERYRYGPGSYKVDYALDGPVPWSDRAVATRGHRPPRRLAGRHRDGRTRRLGRKNSGETVRPRVAAQPVRRHARARRTAHAVDVLPRAARVSSRHAAADRAADRALRAGVSRPDPRPPRDDAAGSRAAQPEPRRRRHRHGRHRPAPDARAPDVALVPHAAPRALPVLGGHAAGRRRPRHVRISRGAGARSQDVLR